MLTLALISCVQDYDLVPEADAQGDTARPEEIVDEVEPEPESDLPVAVCDVTPNPVAPPFESATWLGEDSYDPNGLAIVDWSWNLDASPSGSAIDLNNPRSETIPGFTPDLAGDYTATLVVTNEDGVESEPCEVTLEAIPVQNLWVEMFWAHSGDDMDLHLLAPNGTLERNSDCYYANCTGNGLDWGISGNPDDNPKLDLDDIQMTGPENINVGEPEDGVYTVVVHDYPGSSYQPDNEVTVNIYVDGGLMFSETRGIVGENLYEYFAEIDWANGQVNPL